MVKRTSIKSMDNSRIIEELIRRGKTLEEATQLAEERQPAESSVNPRRAVLSSRVRSLVSAAVPSESLAVIEQVISGFNRGVGDFRHFSFDDASAAGYANSVNIDPPVARAIWAAYQRACADGSLMPILSAEVDINIGDDEDVDNLAGGDEGFDELPFGEAEALEGGEALDADFATDVGETAIEDFGADSPEISKDEALGALEAIDQITDVFLTGSGLEEQEEFTSDEAANVLDSVDDLVGTFDEEKTDDFGGEEEADMALEDTEMLEESVRLYQAVSDSKPLTRVVVSRETYGSAPVIVASGFAVKLPIAPSAADTPAVILSAAKPSARTQFTQHVVSMRQVKSFASNESTRPLWRMAVSSMRRSLGHSPVTSAELAVTYALASSLASRMGAPVLNRVKSICSQFSSDKHYLLSAVARTLSKWVRAGKSLMGAPVQHPKKVAEGQEEEGRSGAIKGGVKSGIRRGVQSAEEHDYFGTAFDEAVPGVVSVSPYDPNNVIEDYIVPDDTGISKNAPSVENDFGDDAFTCVGNPVPPSDGVPAFDIPLVGDMGEGIPLPDDGYDWESSKVIAIEVPDSDKTATQVIEMTDIGSGVYVLKGMYVASGRYRCSVTRGAKVAAVLSGTKPIRSNWSEQGYMVEDSEFDEELQDAIARKQAKNRTRPDGRLGVLPPDEYHGDLFSSFDGKVVAIKGTHAAILLKSSAVCGLIGIEAPFVRGQPNSVYSVFVRSGANLINENGYYIKSASPVTRCIMSAVSVPQIKRGAKPLAAFAAVESGYVRSLKQSVTKLRKVESSLRQQLKQSAEAAVKRLALHSAALQQERAAAKQAVDSSVQSLEALRSSTASLLADEAFHGSIESSRQVMDGLSAISQNNVDILSSLM